MKLDIDMSELRTKVIDPLRGSALRTRTSVAIALTSVAKDIREAERREMLDVFDRPKPYTLNALYLRPATADRLEATVGIKDDASEGRAPVKWLRWQVQGGLRTLSAFEKALVRAGAMDGGDRAVPGRFARRDAYGNISPGQLQQIFAQLRIETGRLGSTRVAPRLAFEDTARDRRSKIRRIKAGQRRAGGQFIAFPYGRGKLRPGIYLVREFSFGGSLRRSDPKPILIFVSKAQYEPGRFDFYDLADRIAQRQLVPAVTKTVTESLLRGRK